jgi:hypothetical protein
VADQKKTDNPECRRAFEEWKKRPDVVLWLPKSGRLNPWRIWQDAWSAARNAGVNAAAQTQAEKR